MKCNLCSSKGPQTLVLLPIRQNGQFGTLVCETCAKGQKCFCQRHSLPHLWFRNGTTACPRCIDEMIAPHSELAMQNKLYEAFGDTEWKLVGEACQQMSRGEIESPILFLIASIALRANKSFDFVVDCLCSHKLAKELIAA